MHANCYATGSKLKTNRMENKVTQKTSKSQKCTQEFSHNLYPVINGNSQRSSGLLNASPYLPIYSLLWEMARNCIWISGIQTSNRKYSQTACLSNSKSLFRSLLKIGYMTEINNLNPPEREWKNWWNWLKVYKSVFYFVFYFSLLCSFLFNISLSEYPYIHYGEELLLAPFTALALHQKCTRSEERERTISSLTGGKRAYGNVVNCHRFYLRA